MAAPALAAVGEAVRQLKKAGNAKDLVVHVHEHAGRFVLTIPEVADRLRATCAATLSRRPGTALHQPWRCRLAFWPCIRSAIGAHSICFRTRPR